MPFGNTEPSPGAVDGDATVHRSRPGRVCRPFRIRARDYRTGSRRLSVSSAAGGGGIGGHGDRPPYGYTSTPYPFVGGPEPCPHCFCSPCVMRNPPNFLLGSSPADIRNASKCYPLYRKFWRVLRDIDLWAYIVRKETRTSRADVLEIMPTCVTRVSASLHV